MKQILTFFLVMSWFTAQGMENNVPSPLQPYLLPEDIKKAFEFFRLPTNASKADIHAAYEIKIHEENILHIKHCIELSEAHSQLILFKRYSNDNSPISPELEKGRMAIKVALTKRLAELKKNQQAKVSCPYPVSPLPIPSATGSSLDIYSPSLLQQPPESNCLGTQQSFALDNWGLNPILEQGQGASASQPYYPCACNMPYPSQH